MENKAHFLEFIQNFDADLRFNWCKNLLISILNLFSLEVNLIFIHFQFRFNLQPPNQSSITLNSTKTAKNSPTNLQKPTTHKQKEMNWLSRTIDKSWARDVCCVLIERKLLRFRVYNFSFSTFSSGVALATNCKLW